MDELTIREREVVTLACQGLLNKQIAARLGISPITVRNHLNSAYRKLGVSGVRGGARGAPRVQALGVLWQQGWRP